jgi:hypothetical protein
MTDKYMLIFDGKEHPGGTGTPNTNVTARKINDRSIEEKWTRDGQSADVRQACSRPSKTPLSRHGSHANDEQGCAIENW